MSKFAVHLARVAVVGASLTTLQACAYFEGGRPTAPVAPKPTGDLALKAVLSGAWRSPAHVERDQYRQPYQALEFWGLRPGMRVVQIQPEQSGWYTEILAPYLARTGGQYIAGHADIENPRLSPAARKLREDFEARYRADAATFGQIQLVGFGGRSAPLGPPNSADMVLVAGVFDQWIRARIVDKGLNDAFFVLRPGGVLAIEQPRATAGVMDEAWMAYSGYVSEDYIIAAAQRAGFQLAGRSEVAANPRDTKDHPFGVWTLAPSRWTTRDGQSSDPNFDRAPFDAIGEPDRMVLKFVKPAA